MTIKIGDKLPDVTLKVFGSGGMKDIKTGDIFAGKKVVMFGVPGAFTPTCAQQHLPDYLKASNDIKAKGVDEIVCLAVNDPFVMHHWEAVSGASGKIRMLPDGNAEFTKAMGLEMDGSSAGLGTRSKRYLMIVDDGVVSDLEIEENPGALEAAAAGVCMSKL